VLKGEMSILGPRPALFNQADVGVYKPYPGIAGWTQVSG